MLLRLAVAIEQLAALLYGLASAMAEECRREVENEGVQLRADVPMVDRLCTAAMRALVHWKSAEEEKADM
jgi:hypothetical protein